MKNLINYFLKYSISGNVLMILLLVFGVMGLLNMQTTFFPEVPSRNINITIVYPGTSPQEIEQTVVERIEDNLKGTSGIDRVTSTSSENFATLKIETTRNADVNEVLQDVKNKIDQISGLPAGIESIDVIQQESAGRAISIAISGNSSLKELKAVAQDVEQDFLNFDGISQVELSGFPEEEIVIQLNEANLLAYGITFNEVMSAVRANNTDQTGGTIYSEQEELKIRSTNKVTDAKSMRRKVIKATADGKIVRLSDVATVVEAWAETPNRNYFNGNPAVSIDVSNTNEEDILQIADFVKAYMADFNKENSNVQINITRDSSKTIEQRIELLTTNGKIGFILVLFFLALFLHYRLAFWVALSIPISFAGMFILASFFGITINVISLFGMITVIGILVDDGIVISENIYRHYENGASRMDAALKGTMEVMPAIFSAILTTMVVFSTFFFIDGTLGDFFSEMSFIVIATLLFSLVEGIFILPAHVAHSKALDKDQKPNFFMRKTTQLMDYMRYKMYKPLLLFCLNNRFLTFAIPIGLFMITLGAMSGGLIKGTFFPQIDGDDVAVTLLMPTGTTAEQTTQTLDYIEAAIWATNDSIAATRPGNQQIIMSVDKRVGPTNSFNGRINIKLLPGEDRPDLGSGDITTALRNRVGDLSEAVQLSFAGFSPFGKPVSVSFRGKDQESVRMAVEDLKSELQLLSDLKDITDSDQEGLKEVDLELKDEAYALGFDESIVMTQVRQGYFGGEIQRIQRGQDEIKVWVRLGLEERRSLEQFKNMRVRNALNQPFYLRDLVNFEVRRGVVSIQHTDGQRDITISADISNPKASASEVLSLVKAELVPPILERYPTVSAAYEGQAREQQKSAASMAKVVPIILGLMFTIIILTFRSVPQTLLLIPLIIFSFIGVAWGHYIHGVQLSLFSYLGIIALIGILVNDSLVFVSAFNNNLRDKMPFNEALVEAAVSRFRPIILTSITTIAGLGPLIFETSMQAKFLIPMAISVAYGLAIATALILIVLPVSLYSLNKFRRFISWYWNGTKKTSEEVEPAIKELKYDTID